MANRPQASVSPIEETTRPVTSSMARTCSPGSASSISPSKLATSAASVLFQISNGGGSFDMEFTFQTGAPVVASISGPDWFGGSLPGTANTDSGLPGANLSLTERTVDLSAEAGRVLTAITFSNRSNLNAGYGIVAPAEQ